VGHNYYICVTQKEGDLRKDLEWEDETFRVPRNICIFYMLYIYIYIYISKKKKNFKMEECQLSLYLGY